MLRLKQPSGELPPSLYRLLDDLSREYGQGDLRATTRQCFQLHGVLKGDLKTVVSSIMNMGSSTVGACGDVSRNVMVTPAPFASPEYKIAREYGKVFGHLFRPMTTAFSQIWLNGEKAASIETWGKEVQDAGYEIDDEMRRDNGRGIVLPDKVEPLYGDRYLPRKFKIGVTVPGDNSLDLYTNDIGCVVITDDKGEHVGFNIMVGGGMGRTHNKENTFVSEMYFFNFFPFAFPNITKPRKTTQHNATQRNTTKQARVADHLGFVSKSDTTELLKSILAAQRDHGNRDVRANARMKYLVHTLGIDNFRSLVESYFGKKVEPWREMKDWKYHDWMGWWDQGDGKLFYGLHVDNGRVKDTEELRLKTCLRVLVDKYDLSMIMSPTQSIIIRDIDPKHKDDIVRVMANHGVQKTGDIDPLARLSMACPALPLCGLAQTEAERRMPDLLSRIRTLLNKVGLKNEEIMIRMTGCPNGCARPYMAELAFVGDGPESYQIWLGGSPVLAERTAFPFTSKVKYDDIEATLEPIFSLFAKDRKKFELFGDFCYRIGTDGLEVK